VPSSGAPSRPSTAACPRERSNPNVYWSRLVMFRLYGPEKPLFDKRWKLLDVEKATVP
jgi:hypothetical protein